MPKAVVVGDVFRHYPDGAPDKPAGDPVTHVRGDEVDVSQAYFDRGVELGVLAKPGKDAKAALEPEPAAPEVPAEG